MVLRAFLIASLALAPLAFAGNAGATERPIVVSSCGSLSLTATSTYPQSQDTTGKLCTGATVTPSGTQDVNVTKVAGTSVLTGAGATGAGSIRVTVAGDSGTVAGSTSIPAGTNTIGNVNVVTNNASTGLIQATASVPITFTAAGGPTQIIAASGSTKIYITHWDVVLSGAGTFALVTGTGTNCGTNTAYLTGASGHPLSFAANGGISAGSGLGPILITIAGGEVCAITTGSVDSSGSIAYAQF